VLLPTREQRFEMSGLRRFGDRGRALLAGFGFSSRRFDYPGRIDIAPGGKFDERVLADSITASPVVAQAALRDAFRVHLLLGARDIRWIERRGLDGMHGAEDIRLGIELGADIGPSIHAWGDDDISAAGLLYGAAEIGSSLFVARGRVDALRNLDATPAARWQDIYANVELFAYLRGSRESAGTLLFRAAGAGGWQTRTPFQLTLGGERGVRGYDFERYPGAQRVVFSLEDRVYLGFPFRDVLDSGATLFADVGRTWAGDAPFTVDSGWPGFDGTDKFLWTTNGDVEAVERALNRAEIGFAFTTSVDEALDLTKFQVIIWTFDFLELYAALAGIIVVGAILLYADTRQRERNLSYALAVRMGLTRREHLTAGFLEFGGLVFLGGALGSFVAYLAARSIYPALDALPSTPPPPQWVGVLDVAVVLGILALIVGLVASHVAQRTADSADVSELLRHGG
jgi:hypothetical protein